MDRVDLFRISEADYAKVLLNNIEDCCLTIVSRSSHFLLDWISFYIVVVVSNMVAAKLLGLVANFSFGT